MKKKNSSIANIWEIENYFYLNSDISRINKIICHYEIFKKTLNIPGSIVECGVFKGVSLIRFLNFRDLLKKNSKKYMDLIYLENFLDRRLQEIMISLNHMIVKLGLV